MKLAILGDFHFGYERFYEDSFAQAERALRKACAEADLVLLVGDLFDARVPKPEVLSCALKIFKSLPLPSSARRVGEGSSIPIIAIHGTHERRTKDMVNPIQTLETAGFLLNAHNSTIIFEKEGERVAVQGLGGVPDEYARSALAVLSPKPVSGAFNAFVFHQTMNEFVPAARDFLSAENLPDGFDLYVCGHIHRKIVETVRGKPLLIPGSTVLTQLKEDEQAPKGFLIFDTRTKQTTFREIPTRAFFFRKITLGNASPTVASDAVSKELRDIFKGLAPESRPIIKIKLLGALAPGFESANISFDLSEFEKSAFIEIDKELESSSLAEKIEKLRALLDKKVPAREMGLEVLKARLKEKNFKLDGVNAEELFSLLTEDPEKALQKILEK